MDEGTISIRDITMTLLPTFFVSELTKYFAKEGNLSKFYMLSWYWGFSLVSQIKKQFSLDNPEKIYSVGMDLGEAMGIGIYKTHNYYPGRFTHFIISNNPFLKDLKTLPKKEPIDYFISGCMAGGGCLVHNTVCQTVEVKCMLSGEKYCEFVTGTEKELKKRGIWDLAVTRYNLKKIYALQKEIFKKYNDDTRTKFLDKIMEKI